MFCDNETEKSQGAYTIDANTISEINVEIVKPTLLDKQIPTKAFSSYDLQCFGEVKFQSLSHNTIGGSAQSVLLSFDNLRCFDPGGFLLFLFFPRYFISFQFLLRLLPSSVCLFSSISSQTSSMTIEFQTIETSLGQVSCWPWVLWNIESINPY